MEFIHPYFLLGLPLAALPVIIHLWFRRRLKRIEFPSLKFLYTMERREFNWLRLREILILILRTITIIALFLALARPTVKTGLFGFNRTASLFLIIDDSYSMAYKDLFAKAKEIGCDLIDHYTQASQFLIVPLSQTDDFEFLTKERAQEKIQRLMVSQRKGDLGEVLERLRTVKTRYPKDFVFLTDLQAKNFTRITQPLTFKVKIIPISDDGDNTSITDIRLKDPVTIGLPVLLVKIKNYGVKPWSGKAILNSGLEQNVVLNPEEEKMVEFVFGQNQPTISGWVEVKEDFLSIDNIRYFFFKKMTKKKILIIMPDGYSDNIIKSALSPPGVQSPFAVEVIPQSALSQVDFNRFDGLIISNLTELNLFSLKKIEDFMNHKPVLILLGDRVNPSYEKFLSQYCTFQGLIVLDGFTTISYFDSHHPIFKIFGQKDFTGVKFYRITNIEPVRSKILSRFESGNVFLLEAQNLIIVTTSFDLEHTDFIYKPIFVPFLHRLLGYMTQEKRVRNYLVGDVIEMEASTATRVKTPSGIEYLTPERGRVVFKKTDRAGLYQIGDEQFVVNVDPDEGDLKKIGVEALKRLNCEVLKAEDITRGGDLSSLFLIFVIIALILEMVLLVIKI